MQHGIRIMEHASRSAQNARWKTLRALLISAQLETMSISTPDQLSFIFGRRSIRVYSPGEIDDRTVTRLLEAAMAAPSAMTKDPWRFVVVRKQQTLSDLAARL